MKAGALRLATRAGLRAISASLVAASVGCASLERPSAPAKAPAAAPKPQPQPRSTPRFNLAGFSEAYREGHADACARPARRNGTRFEAGGDYAMGWNDGRYACEAR